METGKKMKRRVFFTTLLSAGITAAASLLFVPGLNAADEKKTASDSGKAAAGNQVLKIPLRVMSLPDPKSTDPNTKVQLEILREFRRLHPNIELSPFSGIEIQNIGMESRLMLAIAGGAAPDVINVNFRMSDTYIQQNFLWPLDKYIENDPELKSIDNFLKSLPAAIRLIVYRDGPAVPGRPACLGGGKQDSGPRPFLAERHFPGCGTRSGKTAEELGRASGMRTADLRPRAQ